MTDDSCIFTVDKTRGMNKFKVQRDLIKCGIQILEQSVIFRS